jgi:hypothetical protein
MTRVVPRSRLVHRHASGLRALASTLAFALATLLACTGTRLHAEANPYAFGLGQSFGHNSNLYRTTHNELPDKFSVTSLNLGIDQPIGRQRLFAGTSVRATRYEDVRILDNVAYGLNAGLDWSTIERLSGSLGVAANRTLANYAASGNEAQTTKRNLETSEQANLRLQLGVASLLALNTAWSHSEISYTAPEYQAAQLRQNAGSLGFTYRPSALLNIGAALRATRGKYPNVIVASTGRNESFERNDVDLTSSWVASGLSTIGARLSYGRSVFEAQTLRNFAGVTGTLTWDWKATGKLKFNTTLSRDSGSETALYGLANNQGTAVGDNSMLTNAMGLGVGYEASAKIRIALDGRFAQRELVSGSSTGSDRSTNVSLALSYAPTRSWQLGCSASQDGRKPSADSSAVSTRYSATQANCNVQLIIR